jgi:hypothetical protein
VFDSGKSLAIYGAIIVRKKHSGEGSWAGTFRRCNYGVSNGNRNGRDILYEATLSGQKRKNDR